MRDRPRRINGRRARGVPRARTIAVKHITREDLRVGAILNPPVEGVDRPVTREDCRDEERPCPFVACRHHLYLEINPETGSIKINFPDREPWELQHTCSLDVADRGAITLEEVGEITNLTRERIRQVEVRGLLKLRLGAIEQGLGREDVVFPHAESPFEAPRGTAREESAKRARDAYRDRQRAIRDAAASPAAADVDEDEAA